jgi:hypothetical protein
MKDLYNNTKTVSLLDPIAVSTTQTITDVDLAGFNSAKLNIHAGLDAGTGLSASHKIVFVLSDSDDGTTYAAVEDADMLGVEDITSGTILTIDSEDEDNTVYSFGYVGGKRYLQLVGTVTGTISMPMAITLEKGHPLDSPVA